jgi:hypothetical protein
MIMQLHRLDKTERPKRPCRDVAIQTSVSVTATPDRRRLV